MPKTVTQIAKELIKKVSNSPTPGEYSVLNEEELLQLAVEELLTDWLKEGIESATTNGLTDDDFAVPQYKKELCDYLAPTLKGKTYETAHNN